MDVIVQASLQSKRLPNKVLLQVTPGESVVERVVRRWTEAGHRVLIQIPADEADNELMEFLQDRKVGAEIYRMGRKQDTYRLRGLLQMCDTERVARVTADCPFSDPALLPQVEKLMDAYPYMNVAATHHDLYPLKGYPPGFDIEVMDREVAVEEFKGDLKWMWRYTSDEQITPAPPLPPGLSCTIDYWHDFEWCQFIAYKLGEVRKELSYENIAAWWKEYSASEMARPFQLGDSKLGGVV